jgi:maleylpyruvate isomerase
MSVNEHIVLHNYFRSSASYRVRIALNLKKLSFNYVSVHLSKHGGEQFAESFKLINAHSLVPVLEDDGKFISQSLAILEYLDERYPETALLPIDINDRAYVRQLALLISCDIHPLNNLRVLKYLTGTLEVSEDQKMAWIHHWIGIGLQGLEKELALTGKHGKFCFGDTPTMADCCLVPQIFSAKRFNVDLTDYPILNRIYAACEEITAFKDAAPSHQPDFEK